MPDLSAKKKVAVRSGPYGEMEWYMVTFNWVSYTDMKRDAAQTAAIKFAAAMRSSMNLPSSVATYERCLPEDKEER